MRFKITSFVLSTILVAAVPAGMLLAQSQTEPANGAAAAADSTQAPAPAMQPHHAPNPRRQARMMAKKLGLTADQKAKIEPILADRQQQLESVRADNTLAAKDRHSRLKGINQDSDQKIEAVLSDSQKQQYQQMKQDRRARKAQQPATPGE